MRGGDRVNSDLKLIYGNDNDSDNDDNNNNNKFHGIMDPKVQICPFSPQNLLHISCFSWASQSILVSSTLWDS
jgi:hypothetical protein